METEGFLSDFSIPGGAPLRPPRRLRGLRASSEGRRGRVDTEDTELPLPSAGDTRVPPGSENGTESG